MMLKPHNAVSIRPVFDIAAKVPTDAMVAPLYEEEGRHLMLESVTLTDIELTFFDHLNYDEQAAMMLEAITTSKVRLNRTMSAFCRTLNTQLEGSELTAGEPEVGRARKSAGIAIMPAVIPLSDGQTITLFFHSPTNDPSKIAGDDTLVAFRFLLNKRDITHVVSPDGGRDVSLKQVCLSLANLAERNAGKFKASQERTQKLKNELAQYQAQADQLQADSAQLIEQGDKLGVAVASNQDEVSKVTRLVDKQVAINDDLRTQIERARAEKTAAEKAKAEKAAAHIQTDDKTPASGALLKQLNRSLYADISHSLDVIYKIDTGEEKGYERSLFVSSIANKLKTQKKNGNQDVVNSALALICEKQEANRAAGWDKPLITDRHSIWKLGTGGSTSAVTPPAEDDHGVHDEARYYYGLKARAAGNGATPVEGYVDTLDESEFGNVKPNVQIPTNAARHGIAVYNRPLTPQEVSQYELVDLNNLAEQPSATPVSGTGEPAPTAQDEEKQNMQAVIESALKTALRSLLTAMSDDKLSDNYWRDPDAKGTLAGKRTISTSAGDLTIDMPSIGFLYNQGFKPPKPTFKTSGLKVIPEIGQDGHFTGDYILEAPNRDVLLKTSSWSDMKTEIEKHLSPEDPASTEPEKPQAVDPQKKAIADAIATLERIRDTPAGEGDLDTMTDDLESAATLLVEAGQASEYDALINAASNTVIELLTKGVEALSA